MKIREHLSQHEFASSLLDRFDARYNLQTSDLHLIAFFLDPNNLGEAFGTSDCLNRIFDYFEGYGGILDAKSTFRKELLLFRKRKELGKRALFGSGLIPGAGRSLWLQTSHIRPSYIEYAF
jgi:hypothetical protein